MRPCLGQQLAPLRAGAFEVAETRHAGDLHLPRHAHPGACIHLVLEGVYRETTERGSAAHATHALLYKPPGAPHWNRFDAGGARTLRIEVAASAPAPSIAPAAFDDPLLRDAARRLGDELRLRDAFTALSVEGLCLELLARIGRARRRGSPRAGRDVAVRAARLLEERCGEPVRLSELAEELGVNRSHLARAFRERHGCTMGECLRRARVERVRAALVSTDLTLAEIAAAAGFADQSHCARVFRRIVGVPPSVYRADRR